MSYEKIKKCKEDFSREGIYTPDSNQMLKNFRIWSLKNHPDKGGRVDIYANFSSCKEYFDTPLWSKQTSPLLSKKTSQFWTGYKHFPEDREINTEKLAKDYSLVSEDRLENFLRGLYPHLNENDLKRITKEVLRLQKKNCEPKLRNPETGRCVNGPKKKVPKKKKSGPFSPLTESEYKKAYDNIHINLKEINFIEDDSLKDYLKMIYPFLKEVDVKKMVQDILNKRKTGRSPKSSPKSSPKNSPKKSSPKKTPKKKTPKECAEGKIRNPKTGRCIKIKEKKMKK